MIRRVSILTVLGLALSCSTSSAEEARVSVHLTGIGSTSCAHWRSTKATRLEGIVWIHGFWSGLNYVAAASDQAQSSVSETAMVAEVDKVCAQRPSDVLASAAWTAYLDLNAR
ncbi:MAG: hypothetical protein P4M07_02665 [Xanthobacteraceae bacterium]|nr:hypothetical protein [Xanthobacteraceae bacterium]